MKFFVFLLAMSLSGFSVYAQSDTSTAQSSTAPAPAWSPSKDIGVFVFGKNNQTPDQQLKDESDCYGAAKQQSGIDPKAPAAARKTTEQKQAEQKAAADNADTPSGGRIRGAARGATGGAALGAIAGDAGKGAGAGAVAGTMRGGMTQRQASAAAKKEAAAKVATEQKAEEERNKLSHAEGLDTFQRAFAACIDARNYSVKKMQTRSGQTIPVSPDLRARNVRPHSQCVAPFFRFLKQNTIHSYFAFPHGEALTADCHLSIVTV